MFTKTIFPSSVIGAHIRVATNGGYVMALHAKTASGIKIPPPTNGTPNQYAFTAQDGTVVVIDVNAFNNPIENVKLIRADGFVEKLTL